MNGIDAGSDVVGVELLLEEFERVNILHTI